MCEVVSESYPSYSSTSETSLASLSSMITGGVELEGSVEAGRINSSEELSIISSSSLAMAVLMEMLDAINARKMTRIFNFMAKASTYKLLRPIIS